MWEFPPRYLINTIVECSLINVAQIFFPFSPHSSYKMLNFLSYIFRKTERTGDYDINSGAWKGSLYAPQSRTERSRRPSRRRKPQRSTCTAIRKVPWVCLSSTVGARMRRAASESASRRAVLQYHSRRPARPATLSKKKSRHNDTTTHRRKKKNISRARSNVPSWSLSNESFRRRSDEVHFFVLSRSTRRHPPPLAPSRVRRNEAVSNVPSGTISISFCFVAFYSEPPPPFRGCRIQRSLRYNVFRPP